MSTKRAARRSSCEPHQIFVAQASRARRIPQTLHLQPQRVCTSSSLCAAYPGRGAASPLHNAWRALCRGRACPARRALARTITNSAGSTLKPVESCFTFVPVHRRPGRGTPRPYTMHGVPFVGAGQRPARRALVRTITNPVRSTLNPVESCFTFVPVHRRPGRGTPRPYTMTRAFFGVPANGLPAGAHKRYPAAATSFLNSRPRSSKFAKRAPGRYS